MHCTRPRQECEDGLRTLYAAFERRLDEARARLALTPLAALLPPPMLAAKRRATTVEILTTTLPPVQNTALRLSYKVYTIPRHHPALSLVHVSLHAVLSSLHRHNPVTSRTNFLSSFVSLLPPLSLPRLPLLDPPAAGEPLARDCGHESGSCSEGSRQGSQTPRETGEERGTCWFATVRGKPCRSLPGVILLHLLV